MKLPLCALVIVKLSTHSAKGITDKEWLRARGNHIWDEWCSPDLVAYGHDSETKKRMMEELAASGISPEMADQCKIRVVDLKEGPFAFPPGKVLFTGRLADRFEIVGEVLLDEQLAGIVE